MSVTERNALLLCYLEYAIALCQKPDHLTLLRVVQEETQDEIEAYARPLRVLEGGKTR